MEWKRLSAAGRAGVARRYVRPVMTLLLLMGALVCGNAWAQRGGHGHGWHGHHRSYFGLSIGVPLYRGAYGPGWYGDPYWAQPRPIIIQAPVHYIERSLPVAAVWYFCADPQGYYPYVKQCMGAWRTVPTRPVIR